MSGVAAAAVAVALAAFQPWKAVIDETVNEAVPVTVAATVPVATLVPVVTTTAPVASTAPVATTTSPATTAPAAATTPPATTAPATTVAAPPPAAEFRGKAHGTSGTVQVLTLPDGSRVLRIEDLDTSNGPDLKVVLSPDPDGYAAGALSLGTLKGNKGSQNYEIPPDADLGAFASVVIWCKRFDVDFGVAPLPIV